MDPLLLEITSFSPRHLTNDVPYDVDRGGISFIRSDPVHFSAIHGKSWHSCFYASSNSYFPCFWWDGAPVTEHCLPKMQ